MTLQLAASSLHVLYVIDSVDRSGGAERSLLALAGAYARLGLRLDVAYLHERDGLQDELVEAGATLFPLVGGRGRASWVRRARSLIRRQRPDLVHTTLFESDLAGRLASRLTSTPVVSTLANDSYGPTHYANPHVKRWKLRGVHILDAATARLAARLHAVSTSVADTMAQHLQYPRSRIDVIPRGRDAARLGVRTASRSATARQALGVGDGDQLVLAVARQEHDKGLDVLLPAIAQVVASFPAARLLVAGREGSETPVLQQLIDHHGLRDRVQLLGSRRDVPELLCAADVFVLPSRREGFAGALAEAMALETPIVASDLRPVRETAGSSCALFVEPGDVGGFARAIEGVLAEPDRARERAQRAREHFVRQLTIDAIAPRMVSFYERALGREV